MDNNKEQISIDVFTAFSGYDSQCMALERLQETFPQFKYKLIGWSEIDEPAIASHNAVFPEGASTEAELYISGIYALSQISSYYKS